MDKTYEEKRIEIFHNIKNRDVDIRNGKVWSDTLKFCGVDKLEQLAISEGKRQKTLEVIGEIFSMQLSNGEKNGAECGYGLGYHKALEELKSKLKQREE